MDHHCPVVGIQEGMRLIARVYLGTCVHRDNHKYFLQFLFWSDVLGLFAAATMLPVLIIDVCNRPKGDYDTLRIIDLAACFYGALTALVSHTGSELIVSTVFRVAAFR